MEDNHNKDIQTGIVSHRDFLDNYMVYTITITHEDYIRAKLTPFDYALLDDVDTGKPSNTPLADKLLALEVLMRRIEEAGSTST